MEILVKEGAAGNYLYADLKGQLANEQLSVINTKNLLQQAKLNLCQLMQIDYNSELELERNDTDLNVDKYASSAGEVINTSFQNFPLIMANSLKIKSAERGIKVSQSGFFPSIRLGGNLFSSYSSLAETLTPTTITEVQTGSYVNSGGTQNPVLRQQQNYSSVKTGYGKQINNNLGTFVGINMQVPLFNSFQTKNRVKLAKINFKNTELESTNSKAQLKQNIEQTYLNMTASFERYNVLVEQVKNFEESFQAAEVRFNTGVINSAEYLISKNNLDRTRVNLTQAKYEYVFRTKLLDYYQALK
jgi:outer membrane protein